MMGEILHRSGLEIYQEVNMPDGGRIILANRAYGWISRTVDATNHNVFRVDKEGNIIWQVHRDDDQYVNWKERNNQAREKSPNSQGCVDSFRNMSHRFFERHPIPHTESFKSKFQEIYFDTYIIGRLLWIITDWWAHDLDPETGVATCTGKQVK